MRRIDEILNKPFKDNGAYRVPEGYFSNLNKRIMDSLPQQEQKRKRMRFAIITHWKYAVAACITGILLGAGAIAFDTKQGEEAEQTAANEVMQETFSEEYVKECMDYAMVDNHDVYMYLAEQQ